MTLKFDLYRITFDKEFYTANSSILPIYDIRLFYSSDDAKEIFRRDLKGN